MRLSLLSCASSVALVIASAATPAFAQDAGTANDACPPTSTGTTAAECDANRINADGSRARADQEITVTGTRIKSRNLEYTQPTVTLNKTYIEDRNLTNVADALNESPIFRGSITPNGAQGSFGQGVNYVNLNGLGSNRTLTLINGRRFVSSNPSTLFGQGSQGTQVDLNVVNSLLIDHVDNVGIGGAPIYGSDAIAGTVNVILNTRKNGLTVNALSGVTEEGDNFRFSVSGVAGRDFADGRGNFTVAYQHDESDGVLYNARSFLRDNLGGATNPSDAQLAGLGRTPASGITAANDGRVNTSFGYNNSATDGFPGTIQIKNETIYYLTPGGLITSATGNAAAVQRYQFDATGNLVPFNRGIIFPSIYASGGDGFKFADYSQITSDLKRDVVNAFAAFDVSDALKFFAEGTYFHSRGDELVQQPTFNSNLFTGTSGALRYFTTSPLLTAQARTQLQNLGVTQFQVSRASADLADVTGYSTTNVFRGVLGARGDLNFMGRTFNYEISGNYGRAFVKDIGQDLNAQNFINAVNVGTDASGNLVCSTAVTAATTATPGYLPVADAACQPLNLLGFGRGSQAARDYVISENTTRSLIQQAVFNVNVGGTLFTLFGNEYGINVGYEHRDERSSFTPSAFQQQGLGRSAATAALKGNYNLDEFFGEAKLPLITPANDLKFISLLEVDPSIRHVDNTVNGGFTAWSVGGKFAPVRDITFRGNYTRSFRAPAITELFLPRSPAFSTVPDLCSPGNRNAGAAPAIRAANCAAFLAAFPNATPLDAAAATVPSISGGNPTLLNEEASSFSYGVILQPRFIPGLTISADYVDIYIRNPISNLSVATIASACFDNASFNTADPANGNSFCSQIQRYAAGQGGTAANGGDRGGQVVVDSVNPGVSSGYVNGKSYFFSGIQGQVDYTTELNGIGLPGRFSTGTVIQFVRRRLSDITGVAPVRTDGTFGDPKFQAQTNLRYSTDDWGISTSVNFIGEQIATRLALSTDLREFNTIDSYATVNASFWVDVQKKFRLTFSVTNVGNRVGQEYYGYYPVALLNDLLGRRFAVSARANF